MFRIVTDGAADMPVGWDEEYDIQVIPINIQFGEKTYLQGVDLSNEDFYRLVEESGRIPKTSQPSPFQFKEFYEHLAKPGDSILSLHVTSKLSGTFDSAVAAAGELADKFNIIPFDSASGSAALGMMCREARLLERAGVDHQQIVERMYQIRRNVQIVLTLDKLDYARMSGRVGTLPAALASVLNVKPIVVLRDGFLDMREKVRTRSKAINRVLEMLRKRFEQESVCVAVVHACDPQSAQLLFEQVRKLFNCRELIMTELSIAVAANLGPGTVGLVVYPAGE
jgi:DegV family protein with EDD domain